MKSVAITGASAPLGIALIDELLVHDINIVAICRRGSQRISLIPKSEKIRIVECDLEGLKDLQLEENYSCDVFFHLAWASTAGNIARDNINAHIKNIEYTVDAVELAYRLKCKRFIGAGSQAEYGRVKEKMHEKMPTNPESAYGIAKLCAGQMSRLKCEQLKIEHIWTRILSVYGPYDSDKTIVMSVVKNLLNNKIPKCTRGEQIWDFIYSKDAAKALYLVGNLGKNGSVYCIGSGEEAHLKKFIEKIRDIINPKVQIGFGDIPYSEKQVMYLAVNNSKLKEDTGFKVEYSFEEGIREIVFDYLKRNTLEE